MARLLHLKYLCYSLLPIVSVVVVLGMSWVLSALVEIYTNNLTMFKTLDRFTKYSDSSEYLVANPPYPGKDNDRIFWFVQISDIHISKFRSYGQVEDLKTFCSSVLPRINPALVMVTGDLTDAKDVTNIGSSQYEEEWKVYASVLDTCQKNDIPWLDIRGNHDDFAVSDISSKENMFNKYAASRNNFNNAGVYQYIYKTPFGIYAFNGIDVSPQPGPGRPFNFFGVPEKKTLDRIQEVSSVGNFNATVWYGHYPLSTTTSPHMLRTLLSSGIVYICGHLHTLLGMFPQMHAVHSEGFLELELGDWKEYRRYRIGVFDHDVFSFADATFPQMPVVIFTNPTDARYIVPNKMPVMKSRNSTHIRFLLFDEDELLTAEVRIHGQTVCTNTEVTNMLHTCRWKPSQYLEGLHKLTILVKDAHGKTSTFSIEFSLDGTRPPLSLHSVILLLTDFCTMMRMIFIVSIILTITVPFSLKKYSHNYHIGVVKALLQVLLPQLNHFLECDEVFWPFLYYNCFLCIGPMSIGYFVPGSIGFLFPFGMYTGGHFITGSLTYLYAGTQLLFYNSLLMLYLGEVLNKATDSSLYAAIYHPSRTTKLRTLAFHILYIFVLCNQVYSAYMFYVAYGFMSSLINPIKTWTIPLAIYLLWKAKFVSRSV